LGTDFEHNDHHHHHHGRQKTSPHYTDEGDNLLADRVILDED
jgi:hypothetical protein